MVKKIKLSSIRKKRNSVNNINNNYSLVNINELKLQLENAFWSGLIVGALGVITAFYLTNNKSEKKETNHC